MTFPINVGVNQVLLILMIISKFVLGHTNASQISRFLIGLAMSRSFTFANQLPGLTLIIIM